MPKKLLALLCVFIFVTAGFLFVNFSYSKNSPLPSFSLTKPSPIPEETSTLTFSPNPLQVTVGATASANILLEAQGSPPNILQLEVAYDPTTLTNMSISPGNFSEKQIILLNKINPNTGRISYAVDISDTSFPLGQGAQIVATVHFTPINPLGKNETYINFLPKTAVKGVQDKNTLKAGYGMRIILDNGILRQASESAPLKLPQ